jgi:hypothetical protein
LAVDLALDLGKTSHRANGHSGLTAKLPRPETGLHHSTGACGRKRMLRVVVSRLLRCWEETISLAD